MTSDNPGMPRKNMHAFWLFFPAAALLAALAVPLPFTAPCLAQAGLRDFWAQGMAMNWFSALPWP